eukprot:jgi/Ulvmu1/3139/UM015_0179.1
MIATTFARSAITGTHTLRLPVVTHSSVVQSPRRRCVARSESSGKGNSPKSEPPQKVRKAVEAMKREGVDDKVARKVLQAWEDEGIDSKTLQRRLLGVGISVVGLAAFQLFTDILAAYCSTTTATVFGNSTFFGAGLLAIAFQTLYYYFAIGAAFDTFRLGAVIGGAASLGANTDTLYAAIEQLAGEQSGLGIVDKAQAAVSTTKVVLALNSVRRVVKEEMGDADMSKGTLANLNAYFVLQKAEKDYNFKVEDVEGLTQEDAMAAAGLFAKFDANDDGRLEMSEFKRLCDTANFGLTSEEVKAAISLLDKRGSGYVEFDEFVSWWSGVHQPQANNAEPVTSP